MSVFSALLNNGPLLVGPLADRGAFDQYASYRPGQIVVDGGVVYLNIAGIGAAPELEDTFDRRDQQGWGTSSHGEAWQTSDALVNNGPPRIVERRGAVSFLSAAQSDGQLLGPTRVRADAELLAALTLPFAEASSTYALVVALNATDDYASYADVVLTVDDAGVTGLVLRSHAPAHIDADEGSAAGASLAGRGDCFLRLRRVGLNYSATLWNAGLPEPSTPQATHTASAAQPAGHPSVGWSDGELTTPLLVNYLSVRPLSATAAPSTDADHWVALADALQVAPPL